MLATYDWARFAGRVCKSISLLQVFVTLLNGHNVAPSIAVDYCSAWRTGCRAGGIVGRRRGRWIGRWAIPELNSREDVAEVLVILEGVAVYQTRHVDGREWER